MSEDLQEGRGVIDVLEPWVLVNGVAKVRPRCPGGVGPTGLARERDVLLTYLVRRGSILEVAHVSVV